ncbi:hypothetical protein BGZ83_010563 [Gryganskiella cystojenkinii]|nr:hypothetical protein BGZ83_010563 [Gryganskiella cystojenkinii]
MRSVSLGRVPIRSGRTSKGLKSNNLADSTTKDDPLSRVERITRGRPRQSIDQFNESTEDTTNNSNNGIANGNVNEVNTTTPAPVSTTQRLPTPPRPLGLIATQFYGIESSMRWREGVDPIQKRFSSSNGAWRCQDRFAIFFRPGDQIGPDQIVTKTFWSEAWPYPIETLLYGTVGVSAAEVSSSAGTRTRGGSTSSYSSSAYSSGGHSSDQEGDRQTTRGRVGSNSGSQGPRFVSSESPLKTSASFPSSVMTNKNRGGSNHDLSHKNSHLDPRYITSDGVQKIAKVVIPMPDIAIDQMDVVKAPIKVELRIFLLESPLRIHATAVLLGRTVAGLTELYI